MRRHLEGFAWGDWFWRSLVGALLGGFLAVLLAVMLDIPAAAFAQSDFGAVVYPVFTALTIGAVTGGMIGTLQQQVLDRYLVAGRWPRAMALAMGVSAAVAHIVVMLAPGPVIFGDALGSIVQGVVEGLFTGLTLLWMVRTSWQPRA